MQNKSRFLVLLGLLIFAVFGVLSFLPDEPSETGGRKPGGIAAVGPSTNPITLPVAPGRAEEASEPQLLPAEPESGVPVNWASVEMRQDILWQKPVAESAFAAFQQWTARYASADEAGKSALVAEGRQLAEARRAEFANTMREDPARALELAVPMTVRRTLPPEVLDRLEWPVDARGDFEHLAAIPAADAVIPPAPNSYEVRINGAPLRAYVTAERAEQLSRNGVPIHGYKLDDEIVLRPTAGRLLEPVEVADARAAKGATVCPTSKLDTQSKGDEAGLAVGGETELFCSNTHAVQELEGRTASEQSAPPQAEVTANLGGETGSGSEIIAASSWTEGAKKILMIRIDWSDWTNAPGGSQAMMDTINNRWTTWSYGRCTVDIANSDVTPILRMPDPVGSYAGAITKTLTDARNAAANAGYTLGNYQFHMVLMDGGTPGFGWAGLGAVGGNWSLIRAEGDTGYGAGVALHEIGHNLGLNHAGSYTVGGTNPIATGGTTSEYGDPYDVMGGGGVNGGYNSRYKLYLNWLTGADYTTVTKSGIYRIAAHDKSTSTGVRGLKVARTTSQDYTVEYRTELSGTQNTYNDNGVQVHWGPSGTGNGKTQILDMTSGSGSGLTDAPLAVGKTFADTPNGVYLTTLAKITGATFDSMDMLVNVNDSTLPAPWTGGDIGAVGAAGLSSFANDTFVMNGAGADIYGAADEFHFVKRELNGDCDIRARVPLQTNTSPWAKAGVMLRDGTGAGATHATMVVTPGNGFYFYYRAAMGGTTSGAAGPALNAAPNNWVRLTRVGNVFTGYVSADGNSWTQVGSPVTIAMPESINGGLAMTSKVDPALGAATFDNVSVVAVPAPWETADIGAVSTAGSAVAVNGAYSVSGSGADIWGAADEFRYVYQTFTGDCEVRARIASLSTTNTYVKAGVMIRDGTAANAANAMTFITSANFGFQYRGAGGGGTAFVAGPAMNAAPNNWIRLVRSGNTFTSYVSANGSTWAAIGSTTIAMGSSVSVGLAVCNHSDGPLTTANFDNVLIGGPLLSPWASADIGAVGAAGSAFYSGGVYTVSGSGADIWGTADEFRFVSQPVSGSFDLRARVASQTNTNLWAKAGVMIRDGTAANAAHAMTVVTPGNGFSFQRRTAAGGTSSFVAGPALNAAPNNWVRLVRLGNNLFSFVSDDGLEWTQVGSAVSITMSASVEAGLVVTSHADGTLSTATFDNVTISDLHAPAFTTNPVIEPDAYSDVDYGGTLAGSASDADGDPLTFSKISGPAWLSIAQNGTLSGIPTTGNAGTNSFTIRVVDPFGFAADAALNINVVAVTSIYWNGSGTSWNSAGSWEGNSVPTFGEKAVFNAVGVNAAQTVSLNADPAAAGLTFSSTGTVTLQGGDSNRTLTLNGSGIRVNAGGGAVTIGSGTSGQNVAIVLGSDQPWTNASSGLLSILNGVNLSDHALTLGGTGNATLAGVISGTGGSLNKLGSGTLNLTGANTYTGGTTISAGTLQLGNGTVNGTFGPGTYSIAGGAKLYLNYATAAAPTWANITGAGALELNSAQAVTGLANWTSTAAISLPAGFTGTLQVDKGRFHGAPSNLGGTTALVIGNGAQFLAFDGSGNGLAHTFPQNISLNGLGWGEPGHNLGALRVSGMNATFSGNFTLTGNSALYTQTSGGGAMTITGRISDGGLGYGLTINDNNTAYPTLLSNTGNSYGGDTTIAIGTLKLGASNVIPDGVGKGNVIVASGAALNLNSFSETINALSGAGTVDNVSGAGTPRLTVGNSNATGSFSGVIINTTGTLSVTKIGSGTQTLSGPNAFTGPLTINGGVISTPQLSATVTAAQGMGASGQLILNGGTFRYTGTSFGTNTSTFSPAINVGAAGGTLDTPGGFVIFGGVLSGAGTLDIINSANTSGAWLLVESNSPGFSGDIVVGNRTNTNNGLQYRSNAANPFGTGTITVNAGGILTADGGVTSPGTVPNNIILNGGLLGTQSVNVTYSGGITLLANSTIGSPGATTGVITVSGIISGSASLTKATADTAVLSGANTYTGDTIVAAGTLSLTTPFLTDTAAVHLTTGATLNLNHASTDAISKLYINGVLQPAGTWGALGSSAVHQSSLITGTGLLNVLEGPPPFDSWAAANGLTGAGAAKTADPDDDGVPNLMEFAFNGNPNSGSSNGLVFASMQSIGGSETFTYTIAVRAGAIFTDQENRQSASIDGLDYTVEASQDVADWTFSESITEVIPALTGSLPTPAAGWEYHTFRSATPATTSKIFFRCSIEAN